MCVSFLRSTSKVIPPLHHAHVYTHTRTHTHTHTHTQARFTNGSQSLSLSLSLSLPLPLIFFFMAAISTPLFYSSTPRCSFPLTLECAPFFPRLVSLVRSTRELISLRHTKAHLPHSLFPFSSPLYCSFLISKSALRLAVRCIPHIALFEWRLWWTAETKEDFFGGRESELFSAGTHTLSLSLSSSHFLALILSAFCG